MRTWIMATTDPPEHYMPEEIQMIIIVSDPLRRVNMGLLCKHPNATITLVPLSIAQTCGSLSRFHLYLKRARKIPKPNVTRTPRV